MACRHHGIEVTIAEPPFDTITKFFDGQECDFESIFSSNLELILLAGVKNIGHQDHLRSRLRDKVPLEDALLATYRDAAYERTGVAYAASANVFALSSRTKRGLASLG